MEDSQPAQKNARLQKTLEQIAEQLIFLYLPNLLTSDVLSCSYLLKVTVESRPWPPLLRRHRVWWISWNFLNFIKPTVRAMGSPSRLGCTWLDAASLGQFENLCKSRWMCFAHRLRLPYNTTLNIFVWSSNIKVASHIAYALQWHHNQRPCAQEAVVIVTCLAGTRQ